MTREVRLATATEDELMGLDVGAVERRLSSCRRAKARLGGYEATLVRVLGLLREQARAGRSDDVEPEPGPVPADGCGEEPDEPDQPAPEPSRREQFAQQERAKRLAQYPMVAEALDAGLINIEQADILTRADLPAEAIAELLAQAIDGGSTDATRELVRAAQREHDRLSPEARLARQRSLRLASWGIDDEGCYWFHLKTDPITGSQIAERLQREERGEWQRGDKTAKRRRARGRTAGRISPDLRSASQRRADALTHLLLDPRPGKSGGAHLILDASGPSGSVSARTLAGDPVSIVEWFEHFDRGAELYLWLLDTDHRSLDLGRTSRHADDYQRMAMALRDGGCVWKHCDRAAAACDAHHLVEWEAMGTTDLASMALLCPHHHHRLHDMRCRLKPGTSPGEWNLVQTNTRQTVDTWTNRKALGPRSDAAARLRQSTETSQGLRLLA
ncbi:MAG: hypothetical protein KDB16_17590 [Acidimicrobiales bacterium]|nr:hypothetical protein [Acidimicrobiales bacterium]